MVSVLPTEKKLGVFLPCFAMRGLMDIVYTHYSTGIPSVDRGKGAMSVKTTNNTINHNIKTTSTTTTSTTASTTTSTTTMSTTT